jgi:thioredoxin-like negative regulator of GroEL
MSNPPLNPPLREALETEVGLETARLLTQVALLAVGTQRIEDAQLIVDGLAPVFGEYAAVAMARATVGVAAGRQREALEILESLSGEHPQLNAIRCAYAMLKKELGMSGWQVIAEAIAADADDPQASQVAEQMLADIPRRASRARLPTPEAAGLRFG